MPVDDQVEESVPVLSITMDSMGDVVYSGENLDLSGALTLMELCKSKLVAEYMRGIYQVKLAEQQRREALTQPLYVPQGVVRS